MHDPLFALQTCIERVVSESPALYAFAPPLSERSVVAFEARMHVALPREHRRFLLTVAAGGRPTRMGPPHLMTLAEATRALKREGGALDKPFPLTAADARGMIRAESRASRDETLPAIRRDLKDGVLPLMNLGGGEMDFLVVTGPQKGFIWRAWEAGWSPLYTSVRGKAVPHRFFGWLKNTVCSAL